MYIMSYQFSVLLFVPVLKVYSGSLVAILLGTVNKFHCILLVSWSAHVYVYVTSEHVSVLCEQSSCTYSGFERVGAIRVKERILGESKGLTLSEVRVHVPPPSACIPPAPCPPPSTSSVRKLAVVSARGLAGKSSWMMLMVLCGCGVSGGAVWDGISIFPIFVGTEMTTHT